jgi:hypothetical protein
VFDGLESTSKNSCQLRYKKIKIKSRVLPTTIRISQYEKPISLDPTSLDKNKRDIDNLQVLYNIERGELRANSFPLYTTREGGKASSTLSCKKRNFNLKQMNKTKIKIIGRMNNPRPH